MLFAIDTSLTFNTHFKPVAIISHFNLGDLKYNGVVVVAA